MQKILIFLKILQVVSNEKRTKEGLPKLGEGYFDACRANPYNPLSYILIVITIPILIIFVFIKSIIQLFKDMGNPFAWK